MTSRRTFYLFRRVSASLLLPVLLLTLPACDWMPGKPTAEDRWKAPSAITDFTTLYDQNCLGCHSNGKTLSASKSMNDPFYLAFIPRDTLRAIIVKGIPGTAMPAFGIREGGTLTDEQVDSIVNGIYAWAAHSETPPLGTLPPYSAPLGDPARGKTAYAAYCASCHGPDGTGGANGRSIVAPAYLALVSDQYLRTIVVTGRPDLGMPDFRSYLSDRAMSPQEVSDLVAWLVSQRPIPGQATKPRNEP